MLKRRTDIGPIRSADCRLPTRAARQQLSKRNNGEKWLPLLVEKEKCVFYRASCGALELVGRDGSNGGTSSAFVRDPVERIFSRVLAIASQTAPTNGQ
jgi:hypothetical protein